ncbi:hypothetical protein P3S67_025293 [Capsicum chacoense]
MEIVKEEHGLYILKAEGFRKNTDISQNHKEVVKQCISNNVGTSYGVIPKSGYTVSTIDMSVLWHRRLDYLSY